MYYIFSTKCFTLVHFIIKIHSYIFWILKFLSFHVVDFIVCCFYQIKRMYESINQSVDFTIEDLATVDVGRFTVKYGITVAG